MKSQAKQQEMMLAEREFALKEATAKFEQDKWAAEMVLKERQAESVRRKDLAAAIKSLEDAESANAGDDIPSSVDFVFDETEGKMRMAKRGEADDGPADASFDDETGEMVEGDLANANR